MQMLFRVWGDKMSRREKKESYSKWMATRERFRLEYEKVPENFKEATMISSVIPDLVKRLGLEEDQWLITLGSEWAVLAGDAVAAHTRPGQFKDGKLIVFVDSSVWLSELKRYGRKEMLEKLQKRFGRDKIKDLALQMDPDG